MKTASENFSTFYQSINHQDYLGLASMLNLLSLPFFFLGNFYSRKGGWVSGKYDLVFQY